MGRAACRAGAFLAAMLAADVGAGSGAAAGGALDLRSLLENYAAGRFDQALRAVELAPDDAFTLRPKWLTDGRRWIDANPAERRRRLLVASALALEMEHVQAERGRWWHGGPWMKADNCGFTVSARRVLRWAADWLVERGDPDESERAWWLAAVALKQGVRDSAPGLPECGFAWRAVVPLDRFPDEPQFRLAAAVAAAAQFDMTAEDGPRSPAVPVNVSTDRGPVSITTRNLNTGVVTRATDSPAGMALVRSNRARYAALDPVISELSALAADPVVGGEARVRLGYLLWTTGDDAGARRELAAAVFAAGDVELRYLAHFLLGVVAQSQRDVEEAAAQFRAALEARPRSQSAAIALAAIEVQRGHGSTAYELARESLDAGRGADDPWRLFLYGRYHKWPTLIRDLRERISR